MLGRNFLKNVFKSESEIAFGKIVFASLLIIAAILISVITKRISPVEKIKDTINSELLNWDGNYLETKINNVSNLLKLAADEDFEKYSKYKLRTQNVDKDIYLIENRILELKNEINKNEL